MKNKNDKTYTDRPVIRVEMESGGSFAFELWPEYAPLACASLERLVKAGAYDGMAIERIVPGFVIQPRYQDEGRPDLDFMIPGEFHASFDVGVVGMAGDGEKEASGSQFFITLGKAEKLTGYFSAVGKIVDGWDEILRIERVETRPVEDPHMPGVAIQCPVEPEVMKRVRLERV